MEATLGVVPKLFQHAGLGKESVVGCQEMPILNIEFQYCRQTSVENTERKDSIPATALERNCSTFPQVFGTGVSRPECAQIGG